METKATITDTGILEKQDNDTLARWYRLLNTWEWPKELPDPEARYKHSDRRIDLLRWIYKRVGGKLVSRVWNDSMSDKEFEKWWKEKGHTLDELMDF